jgi:drug/metabolite transporter (DMT)-like permease
VPGVLAVGGAATGRASRRLRSARPGPQVAFSGVLAVLCALGAALLYATASVLQQRSASAEAAEHSMRIGLLTRLLRNPLWLLGIAADVVGFVLQFVALSVGTLVLVQPLLVVGLLLALPIGAKVNGTHMARRDWISAAAVCAGLGIFQSVADPSSGRDFVAPSTWLFLLSAVGGLGVVLAGLGTRAAGRAKAILLSAGAGTIYGMAAALTKTVGHLLSLNLWRTFIYWEPYALGVVGVAGMLIAQSAFQAGALDVSLPTMTVVDPVISIMVGSLAFDERIADSAAAVGAEVASLVIMVVGIYGLARSQAVRPNPDWVPPPG